MKVISAFFKFIAILLMIIFVISMPIMLLARNLGQSLNNPSGLMDIIQENILDVDTLASVAEEAVTEADRFREENEEDPFASLVQIGISNLNHDDWVTIINFVLPPDIISQSFDQIARGYDKWLDGKISVPLIRVDLIPWKNNVITNAVPIFDLVMKNFPACNPDQIDDYRYIKNSGDFTNFPQCRPPEPLYSEILETGAKEAPEFLNSYPDYIDNSSQLNQPGRDWDETRQDLLGAINVMRSGWIFIIFLFVIAIPMGARSIHGLFNWAGWPLLLAGIWGLLIGLLLLFFTESIFIGFGRQNSVDIPRAFLPSIKLVIFAFIHYFARPLLIQSAVMIGLGSIAMLCGVLLNRFSEKRVWRSSDYSSRLQSAEEPEELTKRSQSDPQPKTKKPKREDEDDDTPTGMFG